MQVGEETIDLVEALDGLAVGEPSAAPALHRLRDHANLRAILELVVVATGAVVLKGLAAGQELDLVDGGHRVVPRAASSPKPDEVRRSMSDYHVRGGVGEALVLGGAFWFGPRL